MWPSLGGCDFAVNPDRPGGHADIVWLARHNPRLALLADISPALADSPTTFVTIGPQTVATGQEGEYLAHLGRDGMPMLRQASEGQALAIVLPIDAHLPDRLSATIRLWRAFQAGAVPTVDAPTADQLRRRKLILRALDGHLAGATYRQIAVGLFGSRRVPSGTGWRTHHLRSRTIRLVQDGLERMRGGYLRLLRPGRRDR